MKTLFIKVWESLTEVCKTFFIQLFSYLKTFKN